VAKRRQRGGNDPGGGVWADPPFDLTAVGGILYFAADDGVHGVELWRSDGTTTGTSMVKDINPTPGPPSGPSSHPSWLTNVAGTLFFNADDGTHYGLWRSDGTEAGTTLVKEGVVGPGLAVGRILYFLGDDGLPGQALWRSDGTEAGTSLVKRPDGGFSELTAFKGNLYLSGRRALWRSDGTRLGTKPIRGKFSPVSLTAAKGTLYFAGLDRRHGMELWRSNGTRKGTRMVRNIRRGVAGSEPQNLTAVGNTLFFTASDARHGEELWRAGPKPCKTAKGKCKKKK
jgi:ELWxxDGT repeat protein